MRGRVPLARRNLLQDRRRAGLAVFGVGMALVLVLILGGVLDGAMRQVTAYIRHSPADVFISQADVHTMHMSQSVVPTSTVDEVAAVDGVAWVEGLRYAGSTLEAPSGGRRFTYVFGYDTVSGRGGPQQLRSGRAPASREAVIDDAVADELGVDIGDTVTALGDSFRVSGFTTGNTSIANTTVFIPTEDFARLRGTALSYVIVGAEQGISSTSLASRLRSALPTLTVQTRGEFAEQEAALVRDMSADVMRIMTVIGYVIALAVIGLTLFTATLGRLREYGVLKALGAGTARLTATIAGQAVWTVALGLAVAVGISATVGAAVTALTPNLDVLITARSVIHTGLGALAVGGLAALLPLRRLLAVDPATAFRRP
jgi:putative ABC transport system permease protein